MATESSRHDKELLLKLFFEHNAAEIAGDIERVIATLCENPYYELHPIGYRMEGLPAIREFYKRMFSRTDIGSSSFRVTQTAGGLGNLRSPVDVLWKGTDSMVSRDIAILTDEQGRESTAHFLAIWTLQGHRLLGETFYMSEAAANHMKTTLGPDFIEVPGVSLIV